MNVYLVRMIKDKTAFGIFWVEDARELFKLLDEKEDPGEFECLVLDDPGGLFFNEGFAEWKVGVDEKFPEVEDSPEQEEARSAALEQRHQTITENIEFSEALTQNVLLGYFDLTGFVPLSELLKRSS